MAQPTIIIGAGLTGLSTAYHLEQAGFFDYILLEKEAEIGGLCRSVFQDGFIFDYTGHLLHINNPYVQSLIERVIGFAQFNYLQRASFIYSHQTTTPYPFQINLHGLPLSVIAECIEGFARRKNINNPKTFYSWVLTNFGAGFAKHFFIPYQEKQFCLSTKQFSAQWTGRFVPQTSLADIIQGALSDRQESVGYNAHFFYPRYTGISLLPTNFARQLINPVALRHEVTKINLVTKTIYCANGTSYRFETIINTMPLNHLLHKITDTSTSDLARHHHKLQASAVLNINMGINNNCMPDKHWIYTPEKMYPFYRLGFPHNFSSSVTPPNASSTYLECAYRRHYPKMLIKQAIKQSCELLDINEPDIATIAILDLPVAYALYTPWRDRHIDKLLARLREVGIYSIGRYGSWKYASMQEAFLDGQQAAEDILQAAVPYMTREVKVKQPTI